jgi:hypothetical protein
LWDLKNIQEIVSAGGSTVWGNPADVGSIVGGEAFDVVLDNNGKDLEAVRFVVSILVSFLFNIYKASINTTRPVQCLICANV